MLCVCSRWHTLYIVHEGKKASRSPILECNLHGGRGGGVVPQCCRVFSHGYQRRAPPWSEQRDNTHENRLPEPPPAARPPAGTQRGSWEVSGQDYERTPAAAVTAIHRSKVGLTTTSFPFTPVCRRKSASPDTSVTMAASSAAPLCGCCAQRCAEVRERTRIGGIVWSILGYPHILHQSPVFAPQF